MRNVFHHKKVLQFCYHSSQRRSAREWLISSGMGLTAAGAWAWVRSSSDVFAFAYILISFCLRHEQIKYRHCPGMGMGYGSSLPMSGYYHQMGPMSQVKKILFQKEVSKTPFLADDRPELPLLGHVLDGRVGHGGHHGGHRRDRRGHRGRTFGLRHRVRHRLQWTGTTSDWHLDGRFFQLS